MIVSTANRDDLAALLDLEEAGFVGSQRWSAESWEAELANTDRLVLVSRQAGEVEAVACFSVLDDTAELLRVIVTPASCRRGVARRLIGVGQEWAREAGADRMLLEVRHDNNGALALYGVTGFAAISRRRDYYGPGIDALVLECPLPHHQLVGMERWLA